MELSTDRLILSPLTEADTQPLAQAVFSDPDVVGMLAHDTRTPEAALAEARRWTTSLDTDIGGSVWRDGGMGLFGLRMRDSGALAGAAGFSMQREADGLWHGEYFYALGTPWHGQGLMREVATCLGARLAAMADLGVIYAVYWDLINEASGRVLRRSGLTPRGRKPVAQEYDRARCLRMHGYDLWRVETAHPGTHRDTVLLQATRRAAAFAADGVVSRSEALGALAEAHGAPLPPQALEMFDRALALPGLALLERRGPRARPDVTA